MPYRREQIQVLNSIKKAGAGSQVKITAPAKKDSFTGTTTGVPTTMTVFMSQVEYTDKELADATLANGLMKIVVSPLNPATLQPYPNFIELVRNKGAMVEFADGRRVSVKVARFTAPDGVTPILSRIYLGG